ncbi:MAG: minor capsid protein [Armatimonadetes bacterium]|nr:minor capsid protein [Armatimonadota bacterium]
MCAVADLTWQAKAIREAADKSLMTRDLYAEQVAHQLSQSLKSAQEQVHRAFMNYKSLGSLPDNKLAALEGFEKLDAEIRETMRTLRKDHTLMFRNASRTSFRSGVYRGIEELAVARMPFYCDLRPDGIDKLTTSVFTLIDTDALDFMANYNLVLVGDIHRELSDGIKRTILSGIATGKGADDIARDLGKVIEDKESFRNAGSKVFSKAQYRMEMIARTEVLRAHNQGRIKFHREVGVQKLEWLAMEEERMCPVCGGLDGKVFDTDHFPSQPAHPNCRCTSVVAWPLVICGGELGASAAPGQNACILPPQAIQFQAQQKAEEEKKLKSAFESGDIADLGTLTVKQLQTLAKQNGVAVARTKSDFIKLLDQAEPGIHHGDLSGTALQVKIKQYNIAALRSKDELAKLLAEKQAVIKQAKELEEAAKSPAPQTDLSNLTMVQLKDMAKQHGVSLNLTKSEVIDMLDGLEPGMDHSGLAGKALIAAKQKHSIPPLKNKEQLVKALEKLAGQQMAEQAKKQALDTAKQEALKKADQALKTATSQIVMPSSPAQYSSFLESVKAAEMELAKDAGLPTSVLEQHAKEVAVKKLTFQQQVSAMKSSELKDLAKQTKVKHWQWSSKDELITLFTETDPVKLSAAQASIEAKHAKWAEKHLAKPGKAVQPKAVHTPEPQVTPQPVTVVTPNTFTKKTAEFDPADAAWAEHGKPEKFKYVGKASVGGAHEKEFWLDENGDKWLFKPVGKSSDDFIAHGEEAAYKIGRLIDPEAMEVRTIRLNGRAGSIQKWRGGLVAKSDFSSFDVTDLSSDDIAQVQREHVIDWIISNHDGHSKQFLRAKSGKVYGIDKAQLFKFLGSDKLSIDYHPNGACGEGEPFYNTLFRAVKQGKVTADPSVTLRYIREVERISDDDYLALIRPYVEGRFGSDELKKKAFYDLALARKHNLRGDFEEFYADVLNKKKFRFDDGTEAPATGRIGKAEEQIIEEARLLGWQGKTLPIDETDIEDQNALIFTETVGGKERTVIKLKVRPEAESKILPALRKSDRQTGAARIGEPLDEDDFAEDILLAVKTVNHHAQDGTYNKSKLDKVTKHLDALRKLTGSEDPDIREMAQVYIAWIEKTQQAARERKPISEMFESYRKKHSPPRKKVKDSDFTVRKTKVMQSRRAIRSGDLSVETEAATTTSLFRGHPMPDGEQYEIDFGDGIRATYRPWSKKNLYAHSGELEVTIPNRPDTKSLETALEHIEKVGLKANVATADDAEILYLTKQAYITKADRDSEYLRMVTDLDGRNAAKTERIQAMRSFWEKRLGVPDITKLPGYNPVGEYQHGFKNSKVMGGYRHQYRFDISDKDMEKQMTGYSLFHNLTNNSNMSTFLDSTLENNGAMISTVEKLRAGITPGGMSPEADMRSGGASYVFTRIRKSPLSSRSGECGLYFKNRLLRRMDAISYSHDTYGKVTDDYVTSNRGSDPAAWKSFSRSSGNETIFKYSITLLDNLEAVVVSSESERANVLKVFAKHGISVLSDGRKVEDIVLVR